MRVQEPLTVKGGKFELPQLKKVEVVKKITEKPKKATSDTTDYNNDVGVNILQY